MIPLLNAIYSAVLEDLVINKTQLTGRLGKEANLLIKVGGIH